MTEELDTVNVSTARDIEQLRARIRNLEDENTRLAVSQGTSEAVSGAVAFTAEETLIEEKRRGREMAERAKLLQKELDIQVSSLSPGLSQGRRQILTPDVYCFLGPALRARATEP